MKGGRVLRTIGIKEGRERVSNVTRFITSFNDDFTVARGGDGGERGKATLIGYPERGECSLAAFALLMRS